MKNEITITVEQVEKMKTALHMVYEARYSDPDASSDEYMRGAGNALASVLDMLGVEHEQWNPLMCLK